MTTPTKPNPADIVGAYLSACVPPAGATTAQVVQVINAWNEIAAKLREIESAGNQT